MNLKNVRKQYLAVAAVAVLVVVAAWGFYSMTSCPVVYNPNHQAEVESAIYDELRNTEYVRVSVMLNTNNQSEVLKTLSRTDFIPGFTFPDDSTSWFSGALNRCGVEKLKNNDFVVNIHKPQPAGMLD
jgi:hypothetical protein